MGGGFPLRGPPPPPKKVPPADPHAPPIPDIRRELFPSPKKVGALEFNDCPCFTCFEKQFEHISFDNDLPRNVIYECTDLDTISDSSIRTDELKDMLPSIPSSVQIVDVKREREKDTQSVFVPLREEEREKFQSEKEGSYEDMSDKENQPPKSHAYENIPPPFLGFAATPTVHAPPVKESESQVINANCPPQLCVARGIPSTGPWRRDLPPTLPSTFAHAPGRAARADQRSRDTRFPYYRDAAGLPPERGRERKTWKEKFREGFRRVFRKRSPPPLPAPPLIYVNVAGQLVGNVQHPGDRNSGEEKGRKCAFARIKIFRRPILTFTLLDTGNLSRCLISEDIWKQLKLPLTPTRQKLRSADGSEMKVLGSAPEFKFYFENMKTPVEVTDALVVRGLTVPLNFSMAQIEKVGGVIDCSAAPRNVFRIKKEFTPLLSLSTPYSKTSLDSRFDKILQECKKGHVTEAKLNGTSIQVHPPIRARCLLPAP